MTIESYLTFVLACAAVAIVPGPNVSIIVANSLRAGPKAGMVSVAGTQLGVFVLLMTLAIGLQVIVEQMAVLFDWIRLAGAAYLIWLGYRLVTSRGPSAIIDSLQSEEPAPAKNHSYFWQGFLVLLSNPKALLFFGAFIPQFVDPAGNAMLQAMLLGATFMVVAGLLDSGYALAAGRAGSWLSQSRVKMVERISGMFMIAGGVWIALARR